MKRLLLLPLLLTSCQHDLAGRWVYNGPNITLSTGYQGVSVGVTLWGSSYVPPVTPQAPEPVKGTTTGATTFP